MVGKKAATVWGLLILPGLIALGWSIAADLRLPRASAIPDPDDPAQRLAGAGVYADHCASCHGVKLQGQAGVAPPLDQRGQAWHHPDGALLLRIRTCAPNLSDTNALAALGYIKGHWPLALRTMQATFNPDMPQPGQSLVTAPGDWALPENCAPDTPPTPRP
ncbi:hypothetical protein WCLP8_2730002 [uncultured Gammaproteobacteria bacterium]